MISTRLLFQGAASAKVVLSAFLFGCAAAHDQRSLEWAAECPDLYSQISREPEADADARFREGDRRYIAMLEPGFFLPGINDERRTREVMALGRDGAVKLNGTGDIVNEDTCLSFHYDALEYAMKFNRRMIQLVDGIGAPTP